MPRGVAIAAASELPPGRYPHMTVLDLYEEAVSLLLREWHLSPRMIDGLLCAPAGMARGEETDIFTHERLAHALGLRPTFAETVNAGGATYAIMVQRACWAIEEGVASAVLCLGAGKFPSVSRGGADAMARMVSHPHFEYIYGAYIVPLYALIARRFMHERGTTPQEMAAVAVAARQWAMLHPHALMRGAGPLSVDDVLASRPIAEPFHLLDCSVPCEGGGALVVARDDVAMEINPRPAHILGWGEFHSHGYVTWAPELATAGARWSIEQAYARAGLGPSDIRVAELYDAFTICPIILLEEAGLARRGEGGRLFAQGHCSPGGPLPVNTYGGLLSYGHTGDASGLSMIVEGALQVMGRAGARQVPEAEVVLVHTYGGMMAEHSTLILGRRR
ncbi:MAG: thiolase family protein [Dehalococcoidia bacterium]|jgi:acetyl-CoA acetyltransferase|nr:thiolase family protein [Dehalococcoidia bacterium]